RPRQITPDDIFRALQPLEADDGCRGRLWAFSLDRAPGELVNLLPRRGRLGRQHSPFLGDTGPGIGQRPVEQVRIEPMHNPPGVAAHRNGLLALPKPWTARTLDYDGVDFVGSTWRDRTDRPPADLVASLGSDA